MGFNKGEWSELYGFLYLLENPNLNIVDDDLTVINNDMFKILELILKDRAIYKIIDSDKFIKIVENERNKEYNIQDIAIKKNLLLASILSHKSAKGSFEIAHIQPLINDLFDGRKIKGSAQEKADLEATVQDSHLNRNVNITYNIKSNLGANPTLLNASSHTNFIYEIENINDNIMNTCNLITSRTKLLEKCNFLLSNHATFSFIKVESNIFENNLRLVDSHLSQILSKILLLSYSVNDKNINNLLKHLFTDETSKLFYEKKIIDFANAVTFGMRAGEQWDGTNEVNGGIISIDNEGSVYLLDLIYFKKYVDKYLQKNIYLESPSSTRYKMFEIYKESNKYYLKLNLQIRCK